MSLLEYISDEDLFNEVETLLTKAKRKKTPLRRLLPAM